MKNLDKDPDFLDLLAAWHENKNVSPSRRAELLQRLENDERLRIELAREIEMAGLTRAVQAGGTPMVGIGRKTRNVHRTGFSRF